MKIIIVINTHILLYHPPISWWYGPLTVLILNYFDLSDYPEETLCQGEERYILPKFGKRKKEAFKFVNPLLSRERQHLVRVTICYNPGEQCGYGAVFSHFQTSCVQKFSQHKIVDFNKIVDGVEPVVETFRLPSCCVCTVKRNRLFPY